MRNEAEEVGRGPQFLSGGRREAILATCIEVAIWGCRPREPWARGVLYSK